jgi:RecB family exonuclease
MARELLRTASGASAVLDHPIVQADPAVADPIRIEVARQGQEFTEWSGNVGPHPALELHLDGLHAPTALAAWAKCPRSYLLRRVLDVHPVREVEDAADISPLDRGNLFHKVLERFVAEGLSGQRVPHAEALVRLRTIADQECAATEGAGVTGWPVLWRLAQDRLRSRLERWLVEHEALARDSRELRPVGLEASFGAADDFYGEVGVQLSSGRTLRLKGRIDRIDASAHGDEVLVIDYKSGKDDDFLKLDADPVARGTQLQAAIYALVAAQHYPQARIEAGYWFLDRRSSPVQGWKGFDFNQAEERVTQALDVIVNGAAQGRFPLRPGEYNDFFRTFDNCRYCPFERICPAPGGREQAWERHREAPELASYRQLAEGTA